MGFGVVMAFHVAPEEFFRAAMPQDGFKAGLRLERSKLNKIQVERFILIL
jgi:hypothetical protein